MNNQQLGKQGEEQAEGYLIERGYLILDENYHKRVGEIDLIAFDPLEKCIVFVEVKTRRTHSLGHPEEAVTPQKIEKMQKTALSWLDEKDKPNELWRLDVLAIELHPQQKVTHFKNVSCL